MKKLFWLMFIPILTWSQVSNDAPILTKKRTNATPVSLIQDRTYTSSTIDTTIAYQVVDWKNVYVSVQSKDSARVRIRYQLSLDGTTWGALTTKDSLSTAEAGGDVKSVDFTSTVLGVPVVRFVFDFANATQYEDSLTANDRYQAAISDRAYANSFADTTEWLLMQKYDKFNLNVKSLDSARFVLKYQKANDTSNVSMSLVTLDSLVTADNAGASKEITEDTLFTNDSTWIRFAVVAGAGNFGQGTTTATYTAWYEYEFWVNGLVTNTYTAVLTRKQD